MQGNAPFFVILSCICFAYFAIRVFCILFKFYYGLHKSPVKIEQNKQRKMLEYRIVCDEEQRDTLKVNIVYIRDGFLLFS